MEYIKTEKAPAALGPYSQAVGIEDFIFTSGQIGMSNEGILAEGIEAQTKQALTNLSEILKKGQCSLQDVVKTTIFLANMEDFSTINKIYADFFGDHKPARSTIAVKELPLKALIEIEAVVLKTKI
ncbi:MAG: Rid family detoxifying hydrolase [Sulfurospirillaceae bacterium]|nr:Rid family detoxifying hydrolase [Sulfurospirillaceae bacterium]